MARQISEERTRKEMNVPPFFGGIDPSTRFRQAQPASSGWRPQLEKVGWYLRDHSKVRIEIPMDGYDAEPWNEVTDYCLYRESGEILVVENKRNGKIHQGNQVGNKRKWTRSLFHPNT